jgi:AP-3 complex subunit delta-1
VWICGEYAGELASSLSAMSNILPPSLPRSAPDRAVLSVQAEAKVFALYAARASEDWSAEKHAEAKNVVESVRKGLAPFLSSRDIDIQERAFEFTQLLAFVDADLAKHVPPSRTSSGIPGVDGGFESESKDGEPPYPKSLFLFQPLFTGHELNSVGYRAQEAVRIPEGLDLDAEIVPRGGFLEIEEDAASEEEEAAEREVDLGTGGGAGMDELRRVLRDQERARRGKKKKSEMTAEERAERRKVSSSNYTSS